ncbi:hypothetical protein KP509_07G089100 [Ceratopteris richardii]|uniref:Cyclin n=1 Tax=Ceratopteris richardii TaxID=49495 RepID=A0A8T2UGT3_CERRI|nr:hypothetical protein KP509_07G089100 [Ceratopteris richardii]
MSIIDLLFAVPEDISPCCIRSDLYSAEALAELPVSSQRTKCPAVIRVLASLVERVVLRNERLPSLSAQADLKKFSVFSGSRVPTVTIEQYLERIFRYANCSTSCFVVAYAYIDRLVQLQPALRITFANVHRILIASILVSAKFLDDTHYHNAYYAQIGGISTQEMNKLEWSFLLLLGFRLHLTVSAFGSYCSHLEREVSFGGGYQIERVLQTICTLDEKAQKSQDYSTLVV